MKKKIVCLVLTLTMLFGTMAILSSCNDDPETSTCEHVDENKDGKCDKCGETMAEVCQHVDANGDNKCDKCGKDMTAIGDEPEYTWDETSIIFQMTNNTCQDELPSGCERYLAGEDINAMESIDDDIAERNTNAYLETKVSVRYQYYPNTAEYDWGENIERMYANVSSNTTKDAPDIYCNFVYDMVGASLKGTFANLYSTSYGSGENYFEFRDADYDETVDNRGYMFEYMKSTTLSKHKMYILASDYFIDLIRAFFVVPVNVALLESVGMDVTGDVNGDGTFTIDDFYQDVKDKKWTYDLVAKYSAAVFKPDSNKPEQNLGDTLGFALANGGLSASGMLYTTSVVIIEIKWNTDTNDYDYWYPETNEGLFQFGDSLENLMGQPGVFSVRSDYNEYGPTPLLAIRTRFTNNKVLFGSVILVGSLEDESYQRLKDSSGFGVVPVPLYHSVDAASSETYLTSIHNVGRAGGIAANTRNFAQVTAFLNYQSTHSTDILNQYYDYKLQYDIADGSKGTVEMLQYIRLNVRSSFDKTFEDAIGVFYETTGDRWHSILLQNNYLVDFRPEYERLYSSKEGNLRNLIKEYDNLPG